MSTVAAPTSDLSRDAAGVDPATSSDVVGVAPPPKRKLARIVLPALVLVAAVGGGIAWAHSRGVETTDDAQVEGHVANVAARVSGQVKEVMVVDNQVIKAGDVIVQLDDRDYQVKLASTRADYAAALATLHAARTQLAVTQKSTDSNLVVARGGVSQAAALAGTTQAGIDQAQADLRAAKTRRELASTDFDRIDRLLKQNVVTQADYDLRKSTLDQADASVAQAQARLASAQASVTNTAGSIEAARGRLLSAQIAPEQIDAATAQVELAEARAAQSKAAVDAAELAVSYTQVKAQVGGVVTRRNVEVGQLVDPARPLLAIVPLSDTWVVANFKEDQIADMKVGQTVKIKVDTYGDRTFVGHVDSLAACTGSRFALLPPDNASGNFTKVVQRVPVLVRFDAAPDVTLRPGMSATVTVSTK
ncbi:HlyD family secretion protein [soil metagenome]